MADKSSDIPNSPTSAGEASKGYMTDKDGVVYPKENARAAKDYLSGEGSMGVERNIGYTRESYKAPEEQGGTMGQRYLYKKKAAGSYAI